MANILRPKIEVYEKGSRTRLSPQPPVLAAALLPHDTAILEKHATPQAAEYRERECAAHLLFLSDSAPVSTSSHMGGRRFVGQARRGAVWVLPRLMPHSAIFEGPHGGLVLSIANSLFERHIEPLMLGGRIELAPQFNVMDEQVGHLMQGLLAATQDSPEPDRLVTDLLVSAVSIRLAKRYAVSRLRVAPPRGGLSAGQLRRVLEYISANLNGDISLAALASAASLSMYHFANSFKKSTGLSPHRYVLLQKIQRAQQLLRDGRHSVLDVALEVGFEHQSNFARAFRRLTGASPNTFKRDHG